VESSNTIIQPPRSPDSSEEPTRRSRFRRTQAPPPAPPPEDEPQLLLDRYQLVERLGAGGFGVVWRAHDELLHREVAVKRIWLGPDGDPDRAAREAHASARLSHPAIVALYEACAVGEAFYLISELVEGDTLGRLIADGSLTDEQVMRIGLALTDALEHAHERGVIHRDIKPQNVLIPDGPPPSPRERPVAAKLTDFGGASIAEEDGLTRTGDVLGTLAYMAPEQSEGREVGEEADLYALALLLYESLSGVNPVRGPTPASTAKRIGTRLESLARRRRDLPRELTAALDVALSPAPQDRGTLEDLSLALQDALRDGPPTRRRIVSSRREQTVRQPRLPRSPALDREPPPMPLEQPSVEPAPARGRPGLPRFIWALAGLAAIVWQVAAGRAGVGIVLLAALVPLVVIPAEFGSRRVSPVWLTCLFAPLLGLAGLAGAFPALAGQASAWRQRLALGAIGYWWLILAEPLLDRRLWLGAPAHTPARAAWESSPGTALAHVLSPLVGEGLLLGALLWGAAAVVLPWIVRGSRAALDVFAATLWSALLVSFAPALDAGLRHGAHPSPRGAVLGAVLGALLAVGARALRGPV
jgi:eukaryotic-like serine/threonine-protein kinase